MIRAVFFDAGHTLLYAHPSIGEIYARETERFGPRITGDEFAGVFRPVFREFVKEYASTETASDAQDREMWRRITERIYGRLPAMGGVRFEEWFDHLYRHFGEPGVWRLYDDVEPTLADLRARGLKIAVVSNWDARLRRIADGLGLVKLVDAMVISSEAGVRKPNPKIFERALELVGVAPNEAVHIGDVYDEDVVGARRAGLQGHLIDRTKGAKLVEILPDLL